MLSFYSFIIFVKFSFILFCFVFLCFFFFLFFFEFCLSFSYFEFYKDKMFSFVDFSFFLGFDSLFFFFMVNLVTFFILLYGEVYMEHYNIKKFFFLLVSFYFSMVVLSFSSSPVTLMLGWDSLGISSICLIMFYPNLSTMSNSIFTMFFNRLGDVFLLFALCIFVFNGSFFYWFFDFDFFSIYFIIIISLCAFTKSAQFPLSSWLPLAMSAPTPISAMVHSSTLVTAGIFLFVKLLDSFIYFYIFNFIKFFSCLTFLLGGFMACVELDFKKVVAFSTMSQISMMIVFASFGFKFLCLIHMMFHSVFKSLLFSCSGLIFFTYFMDQVKIFISQKSFSLCLKYFFFVSIFSMSGLLFSSSYYSKDFCLEWEFSGFGGLVLFTCLILGSFFTLSYCSIIFYSLLSFTSFYSFFYIKKFNFLSFSLYSITSLLFGIFFSWFMIDFLPIIYFLDLLFINFLFLLFILFDFILKFKFIFYFTIEVSYMKWLFLILGLNFKDNVSSLLSYSDSLFFKSYYFNLLNIGGKFFVSYFGLYLILFLFFIIMF